MAADPASSESTFDVIVVGAGPVGENVVDRVHRGGLTVASVEAELAGGECSYWACIPSKALLRPVALAAAAGRLPGVRVEGLDVGAVLKRRDYFVGRTDDGGHDDTSQESYLEGLSTFFRGWGRLIGEKQVRVTGTDGSTTDLTARQAVVFAAGSTPTLPNLPGLRDAKPWGSREVTNMESVPRRVVVLGGGVVACESATMLVGLGAQEVTVLSRSELLAGREPWAGGYVRDALRDGGATVLTNAEVQRVERQGDGSVVVTYDAGDGPTEVSADEVVAALGRKPNTADLGLDTVGLPTDKAIEVDDTLRSTRLDWLYAVGDVNGRVPLTHQGKYQGRACADVIVARSRGESEDGIAADPKLSAYADHRMVPQVVFTDPQVASVGLTEAQARDQGFDVRVVEYELSAVAGASLEADNYPGKANLVIDDARQVVVGATFVGPDVAELLHSATVAVVGEVQLDRLWHAVPSFPTVSEVWLRLLETYGL